jgi:hypothetical protein
MYGVEVTLNGIIIVLLNFIKVYYLIKKLLVGTYRQSVKTMIS